MIMSIFNISRYKKRVKAFLVTTLLLGAGVAQAQIVIEGNVYGGGKLGIITDNTSVTINQGTTKGNVFGGGMGADTSKVAGLVQGNATIDMNNGNVEGNLYGGGELACVGEVQSNGSFSHGKTTINMNNGTVGKAEDFPDPSVTELDEDPDRGHIYGGGKGDGDSESLKTFCNVNYATVNLIGGTVQGSVYGGSAFGHVLGNDSVFITGTTVGTNGLTGYDGSVFGGGKGSGYFIVEGNDTTAFAMYKTCGRVAGNNYVKMNSGIVKACLYGGGRLALTGVDEDGNPSFRDPADATKYDSINHGLALVDVRGTSKIGITDTYALLNCDYSVGDIFGGGQGDLDYYDVPEAGCVANAIVNVAGNATVYCTVFGGGEIAGVGYMDSNRKFLKGTGATRDTIAGTATIGSEYELNHDYQLNPTDWTMFDTVNNVRRLMHTCSGNVFGASQGDAAPNYPNWIYLGHSRTAEVVVKDNPTIRSNVFGGAEQGTVTENTYVKIMGGTIGTENVIADSLLTHNTSTYNYGSVYGGGFGVDSLQVGADHNDSLKFPNYIAGRVYGNTYVNVSAGTIRGNVYGGGNMASVGVDKNGTRANGKCFVTVSGGTIGDLDNTGLNAHVFGGGKGFPVDSEQTRNLYANVNSTEVTISGGSIKGSVYGGGAYSHVLDSTDVIITQNAHIGTAGSDSYGNVFGGGRGNLYNFEAGRVASNTQVVMDNGTVLGNVYGGGELGVVNQNTDVYISAGTVGAIGSTWKDATTDHSLPYDSIYHVQGGSVFGGGKGDLSNREFGLVKGNTDVNISGGKVYMNVYGGGEMASVGLRNTTTYQPVDNTGLASVTITGGQVGPAPQTNIPVGVNGVDGYVFGGGKGVGDDPITNTNPYGQYYEFADVNATLVTVNMTGPTNTNRIWGSVLGGAEDGHVLDSTKVLFQNGLIGTNGTTGSDGNIFGGGRNYHKMNYTAGRVGGNTIIDMTGGQIFGNIYGGGRFGMTGVDIEGVMNQGKEHGNTKVMVKGGIVGNNTKTGNSIDPDEIVIETFSDFSMGNVYGGGKGYVDYKTGTTPASMALRLGMTKNTEVVISQDDDKPTHVYGIVIGGGEIANVGHYTFTENSSHEITSFTVTDGLSKVNISGGIIGGNRTQMRTETYGAGSPWLKYNDDLGYVYGGCEGWSDDPTAYDSVQVSSTKKESLLNLIATVQSTEVEISGGWVKASVFGGAESGHVMKNTKVTVSGGQIGAGYYVINGHVRDSLYAEDQFRNPYTTTFNASNSLHPTAHWEYREPFAPFDPGLLSRDTVPTDGRSWFGNVFGGGSGWFPYVKNLGTDTNPYYKSYWNDISGKVFGKTEVIITGGHILNNVYGANESTDVDSLAIVRISGGTVGVPQTDADIAARPLCSYVFGGGAGDARPIFNALTDVDSTLVIISDSALVYGAVFGGGEQGHVLRGTNVRIEKSGSSAKSPIIGTSGFSGYDGHVFGGGLGESLKLVGDTLANFAAGRVGGNALVTMTDGRVLGNLYGGGSIALIGVGENGKFDAYESGPNNAKVYDSINHGLAKVVISGGYVGNDVNSGSNLLKSNQQVGNVYGGGRGYLNEHDEDDLGRVANSAVDISGSPVIYGTVFGGGQMANSGHWNSYANRYTLRTSATLVTVSGTPTIGTALEFDRTNSLYSSDFKTIYDTINGMRMISHTRTGNVFGGGQGDVKLESGHPVGLESGLCGKAEVSIDGSPIIMSSVFGGAKEGAVWGDTKVTIAGGIIGTDSIYYDSLKYVSNHWEPVHHDSIYHFGNVFGGGFGKDAFSQLGLPSSTSHQIVDSINYLAGRVYGNTSVEIKGGQVWGNVYGGGNLASVCDTLHGAIVNGNCTVKVNGTAEIGPLDGTGLNGSVYGGGKGTLIDSLELRKLFANVDSTFVTISGGKIWGSVLGGGSDSHVLGSTSVTVLADADIGTDGLSTYDGNIFGGGRNYLNTNHTNGRVEGNINIAMSGGHIQGTIFGGGRMALSGVNENGVFPGSDWDPTKHGNVTINVSGGEIGNGTDYGIHLLTESDESVGDIFGSGKGDTQDYADHLAGTVTNTNITITGSPRIHGAVFGGGEMASLGHWDSDGKFINGTGHATITIGAEGHSEYNPVIGTYIEFDTTYLSAYPPEDLWTIFDHEGDIFTVTHTCTGNVFGGCQGEVDLRKPHWVSMARSKSSDITIYSGTIMGDVFGGSEQGTVAGDTKVTVKGGTIGTIVNEGKSNEYYFGNVYGAGYGSDNPDEDNNTTPNDSISLSPNHTPIHLAGRTYGNAEVNLLGGTVRGSVFGGAAYASVGYGSKGNTTLNIGNASQSNYAVHGNFYGANNNNGSVMGNVEVHVNAGTIGNSTGLQSDVFGGGLGELTTTGGNVTVTVDSLNNVTAPIIYGDVYGGSAFGSVNDANSDKTTVNILAGSILKTEIRGTTYGGDVYGGGLGETGNPNKGKVYGAITVNVGDSIHQPGVLVADTVLCHGYANIGNNVYGANNTGGSPQDNVTVNIYGTAHTADNLAEGGTEYAIDNVFGGGNYADYYPAGSGEYTASVNIFGCDNTVWRVFGGGDASSSPNVTTYIQGGRFAQVFGGGNGERGPQYAANITGDVYLGIHGGQVGMSFGGSNQNGLISGTTTIVLDNDGPCGETDVDEYFCGGNYEDVIGDVIATITCSNGMHVKRLYGGCNQARILKKNDGTGGNVNLTVLGGEYECVFGGSKGRPAGHPEGEFDAYIEGDVNLTIKGGTIDTVFGGSNIKGNVRGKIIVNIDSIGGTECPLVIHNVYGGGRNAAYTPDTLGCYPQVNVLNGTISKSNGMGGNVFGGGFGSGATVTTNSTYGPKVTIGGRNSDDEATVEGNVYGGGHGANVIGNPHIILDGASKVNVEGDVFGGGKEASVTGNAKVEVK